MVSRFGPPWIFDTVFTLPSMTLSEDFVIRRSSTCLVVRNRRPPARCAWQPCLSRLIVSISNWWARMNDSRALPATVITAGAADIHRVVNIQSLWAECQCCAIIATTLVVLRRSTLSSSLLLDEAWLNCVYKSSDAEMEWYGVLSDDNITYNRLLNLSSFIRLQSCHYFYGNCSNPCVR